MPTLPDKQTVEQKQLSISNAGTVSAIAIGAGGSGYSAPPAVSFSGGGGQGAEAVAEVTAGVVTAIRITNPGWGYTSAPTVTLTGAGTGATATATVNTDSTSGRFVFLCFVSTFEAQEQRSVQSRPVRSCDTPSAPPVTQNTPGVYSASYNLTGGASLSHLGYMILRNAVRNSLRTEFQDKDDLVAAAGGGADRFFAYVTNFQQSMPAEGTVGFTATLNVDGAKTRAIAA
jgi:hypothetical protein